MKSERCNLKKLIKKYIGFCIYPLVLTLIITFTTGAYYERNIYYNLDDITLEIGDTLPEEIYSHLNTLADRNYEVETNAPLDKDGHTKTIGNYSYYLVYNDPIYKFSKKTNITAKLTVVDTINPVIKAKENLEFDYNADINPNDLAECIDLSPCTLELSKDIDTTISGTKEVTIIATDGGGNKTLLTTNIKIKEKPIPVYSYYYPSNLDYMHKVNNEKNSLLSEEEKTNLRINVAEYAKQFIGNPYVYGGTSLTNGTDCSGFTMSIYVAFGYLLPRVATSQIYIGIDIPESNLLPGDLVVYHYGHVGIYVGNGMMVHAGTPATGIVMAPMFPGSRSYRRVIH